MANQLVQLFTAALRNLTEETVRIILVLATLCFVIYMGRRIYEKYVDNATMKSAMRIIENSIDNSFKRITDDMRDVSTSIRELVARIDRNL